MSVFAKLNADFDINWTTVLVGWNGFGVFSPWTDRADEFPPLLSVDELVDYANVRLSSASGNIEADLIIQLLSHDLHTEKRVAIKDILTKLSDFGSRDPAFELRKWRLVLLLELLDNIPKDALYGLMALTEFWQNFGFPPDSPHEVQGRGNNIDPTEYYQDQNLQSLLDCHRDWVEKEREAIKKRENI